MPSSLDQFTFPEGFIQRNQSRTQAEGVIKLIPDLTRKVVNWFEGDYETADKSARREKEEVLTKMMVSAKSLLILFGTDIG